MIEWLFEWYLISNKSLFIVFIIIMIISIITTIYLVNKELNNANK